MSVIQTHHYHPKAAFPAISDTPRYTYRSISKSFGTAGFNFGCDWRAVQEKYPASQSRAKDRDFANITITCTDNIKSRLDMDKLLREGRIHYHGLYLNLDTLSMNPISV